MNTKRVMRTGEKCRAKRCSLKEKCNCHADDWKMLADPDFPMATDRKLPNHIGCDCKMIDAPLCLNCGGTEGECLQLFVKIGGNVKLADGKKQDFESVFCGSCLIMLAGFLQTIVQEGKFAAILAAEQAKAQKLGHIAQPKKIIMPGDPTSRH